MASRLSQKAVSTKIRALHKQVSSLERTLKGLKAVLRKVGAASVPRDGRTVRKSRVLSDKARASLRLHGRYMGYMRQLKPKQKTKIRKLRDTKGVRVAIAKARRLAHRAKAA